MSMRGWGLSVVVLAGLASAPAWAEDITEEMIRAIAEDAARRVAEEVAARVAAEVAEEVADQVAEEVATEVAQEFTDIGIVAGQEDADLSESFLSEATNVKAGRTLWKQCRHCHGKSAYPGKAPKLNPSRYTPRFVFDRVTYGFKKMPAWKDVFTAEERAQLVAYILSNRFSP